MEQINLYVPIIAGVGLFIVTQIIKYIPYLRDKNLNPHIFLYPITIVAVFAFGYYYAPDMTIKQGVDMGLMFAGSATLSHATFKKLTWDYLLPKLIDFLTTKRGE